MKGIGRLLLLAGAAGVVVTAFLPWVTVEGLPLRLDLLRTRIAPVGQTVTGTETVAWPALIGAGAVIGMLGVLNGFRRLLVVLGFAVTLAGAGLVYYVLNLVDIEMAGRSAVERAAAAAAVSTSMEAGPIVLLASGLAILVGALLR